MIWEYAYFEEHPNVDKRQSQDVAMPEEKTYSEIDYDKHAHGDK